MLNSILNSILNHMKSIIIGSEGNAKQCARGVIEKILRLKYPDIQIIWKNCNKCDLIVRTVFNDKEPYWNTRRIPYISAIEYIPNMYYCPFATSSPYLNEVIRLFPGKGKRPFKIAYCCSRKVPMREKLFNKFAKKCNKCYALGKCCGNFPDKKRRVAGMWHSTELIKTYSKYEFAFAVEHCIKEGYITEKILNVFASGAIPIYWGATNVKKFFNAKAFINVRNFGSLDKCVNHVLSMTNEDIEQMMKEPIYNENTGKEYMDMLQIYRDDNEYYKRIGEHIFKIVV